MDDIIRYLFGICFILFGTYACYDAICELRVIFGKEKSFFKKISQERFLVYLGYLFVGVMVLLMGIMDTNIDTIIFVAGILSLGAGIFIIAEKVILPYKKVLAEYDKENELEKQKLKKISPISHGKSLAFTVPLSAGIDSLILLLDTAYYIVLFSVGVAFVAFGEIIIISAYIVYFMS